MLDIHPPHAPTHTWRDFLIHIATIVIGLLIAIGLEQTVESLHHRHQRHELEVALQRDGGDNKGYIEHDIAICDHTISWALQEAAAIEQARTGGPLTLHRLQDAQLYSPNAGVWQAAKLNGVAALLPAGEQNWFEEVAQIHAAIFFSADGAQNQLHASFAALNQAIAGHATKTPTGDLDLSTLSPAERAGVVSDLRAIAERARYVLELLLSYHEDSEYIFTTAPDRLSEPEALQRFFVIHDETIRTHPEVRYAFNPN
jgi:hypothetical protein